MIPFLIVLLVLLVLGFIYKVCFKSKAKGIVGEKIVNKKFGYYGYVLSNYIVKEENGNTH